MVKPRGRRAAESPEVAKDLPGARATTRHTFLRCPRKLMSLTPSGNPSDLQGHVSKMSEGANPLDQAKAQEDLWYAGKGQGKEEAGHENQGKGVVQGAKEKVVGAAQSAWSAVSGTASSVGSGVAHGLEVAKDTLSWTLGFPGEAAGETNEPKEVPPGVGAESVETINPSSGSATR